MCKETDQPNEGPKASPAPASPPPPQPEPSNVQQADPQPSQNATDEQPMLDDKKADPISDDSSSTW